MLGDVLNKLKYVTGSNGQFRSQCPIDRTHSLQIKEFDGGIVHIKCSKGCSEIDVVNKLDLSISALFPSNYFFQALPQYPESVYKQAFLDLIQHDRLAGKRISEADKKREREAFNYLRQAS